MAYSADYVNANDEGLQQKVRIAAVSAALSIAGETITGSGDVNRKRAALAQLVLADGGIGQLERFMFASVAGGAITTSSTDAEIDTRVASIWNDLAGVMANET